MFDRCGELAVEAADQLVNDLIPAMLAFLDGRSLLAPVGKLQQQLVQQLGALDDVFGRLFQQLEEDVVATPQHSLDERQRAAGRQSACVQSCELLTRRTACAVRRVKRT